MGYQPDFSSSYGEEELTSFQIWLMALTQPSEETFSRIQRDPNKNVVKAIVWMFVATLLGSTITVISNALSSALSGSLLDVSQMLDLGEYSPMFDDLARYSSGGFSIGQVFCIPVWAVVGVAIFLIQVGVIHFIAGALGGDGSFPDLIYVSAAYAVPLGLVTSVVFAIPVVGCLGIFVGFYGLYLGALTLKVVHEFDWGKAIATYGILIGIVVVFACAIGVLMLASITALFESLGM